MFDELLKFGYRYDDLYEMTLGELTNTLINKKKGLAYEMWKQAHLITLGISDLLASKNSPFAFPPTPEDASPELYPPKPSIARPDFLKGVDSNGRKIQNQFRA